MRVSDRVQAEDPAATSASYNEIRRCLIARPHRWIDTLVAQVSSPRNLISQRIIMDTSTPVPGSLTPGNGSRSAAAEREDRRRRTCAGDDRATDAVADKATEQVDRLSGTAHRAVNKTADAASSAAEWTATLPEQAKEVQAQLGNSRKALPHRYAHGLSRSSAARWSSVIWLASSDETKRRVSARGESILAGAARLTGVARACGAALLPGGAAPSRLKPCPDPARKVPRPGNGGVINFWNALLR